MLPAPRSQKETTIYISTRVPLNIQDRKASQGMQSAHFTLASHIHSLQTQKVQFGQLALTKDEQGTD